MSDDVKAPAKSEQAEEKSKRVDAWFPAILIAAVLVLGIATSLVILDSEEGKSLEKLLVFGACAMVLGTLTQMTVTAIDPATLQERRVIADAAAALSDLRKNGVGDGSTPVADGTTVKYGRLQRRRILKEYNAEEKLPKNEVDAVLAEEIKELKRRSRIATASAAAWALLALGSIWLAINAILDYTTSSESSTVSLISFFVNFTS